jgi:hypothetical protein
VAVTALSTAAATVVGFGIVMPQSIIVFIDTQFLTSLGPVGFSWGQKKKEKMGEDNLLQISKNTRKSV